MNIRVLTGRLLGIAENLRESERKLRTASENIEDTCRSLRQTGDESMQLIAASLTNTRDELDRKARLIGVMSAALGKIAGMYRKTEQRVADYGDRPARRKPPKYRPGSTGRQHSRTKNIFEEL